MKSHPALEAFGVTWRLATLPTGDVIEAPMYITRVDTHNTHGWQLRIVRNEGIYRRFFSDEGNPEAALQRATEHLVKQLPRFTPRAQLNRVLTNTGRRRGLDIGMSGVWAQWKHCAHTQKYELYVICGAVIQRGETGKQYKFYAGTEDNLTLERVHQALRRAAGLRAHLVPLVQAGRAEAIAARYSDGLADYYADTLLSEHILKRISAITLQQVLDLPRPRPRPLPPGRRAGTGIDKRSPSPSELASEPTSNLVIHGTGTPRTPKPVF